MRRSCLVSLTVAALAAFPPCALAQAPGIFSTLRVTSTLDVQSTGSGALTVGTTVVGQADLLKIDGITNGTAAASRALVTDSSTNIAGINSLSTATATITNTGASALTVGSTVVGQADLLKIDGITNGTATASRALVTDSSTNIAGINGLDTASFSALTGTIAPSANTNGLNVNPLNASYTSTAIKVNTTRAANSAFNLIDLQANSVSQFKVNGVGAVTAKALTITSGSDFFTVDGSSTNSNLPVSITATGASDLGINVSMSDGSFTGRVFNGNASRAANSAFMLLNLAVDGGATPLFRVGGAGNVGITSTARYYLDGVALSGDTYISESSANVMALVSGGVSATLTSGVLAIPVPGSSFASGSAQFPTAVSISPSTHASSRRALIHMDDWDIYQDVSGNGTKDFAITNGSSKGLILSATTGAAQLNHYTAGTATFDASGNITSVSDERMKVIQGPFSVGLRAVRGVQPILYRYNVASGLDTENIYAGFSAQNVGAYIPEAIGKGVDGYYSLNVVPVLAATITAIKEISDELDELRASVQLPPKDRTIAPITGDTRMIRTAIVKPKPRPAGKEEVR